MNEGFVTFVRSLPRRGRVIRAFLPYLRPHAAPLAGGVALGLFATLADVLRPWPLQLVFDGVLLPRAGRTWPLGLRPESVAPDVLIGVAALGLVLLSVAGGLAAYGQTLLLSGAAQRLVSRIRRDLFRRLIALPSSFHQRHALGDLTLRLTGDSVLLRELLVGSVNDTVTAALTLAVTLGMMLWLDWRLTLLSIAIAPPVAVFGGLVGARIRRAVRRTREKEGALAARASESLGAVPLIQAYGAERQAGEAFERQNRSSLRSGLRSSRLEAALTRGLDLLTASGTAATLALGAGAVRSGTLSPGELLVLLAYQRNLYRPVRRIAQLASRSAKSTACGERILEVLEARDDVPERANARRIAGVHGALRFEGVTVCYPRGDVALREIDLELPAGSLAWLRGESGAGKSTLLSLVPRLLDPTAGRDTLDGHDLRSLTRESLRRNVAMVFQESVLFGLTVRENIALGRADAGAEAIETVAWRAGVLRFADRLPQGLDTVVGERGAQLSGGQRQRVAIARAMLRDARVVLLDEPLAHLDGENREHLLAALRDLARDRTVVVASHEPLTGLQPDFECVLRAGTLVEKHPGRQEAPCER